LSTPLCLVEEAVAEAKGVATGTPVEITPLSILVRDGERTISGPEGLTPRRMQIRIAGGPSLLWADAWGVAPCVERERVVLLRAPADVTHADGTHETLATGTKLPIIALMYGGIDRYWIWTRPVVRGGWADLVETTQNGMPGPADEDTTSHASATGVNADSGVLRPGAGLTRR
jgi:hypothetical protein